MTSLNRRFCRVDGLTRAYLRYELFGMGFEPRAYQLVPLLMALKLDPIRLLIADDVGIGKTIEAALITRELLDRGEIERFAVLCPPHLVEQWAGELEEKFHLRAVPVTAASAARLERDLPPGRSIFSAHPHTVVSLDYIKSDRRRDHFLSECPEFVIVDEAHTCTATGRGRHQRYELLKGLARTSARHLVMLTATPHSGDEAAFYRLLGLLDPQFEGVQDLTGGLREELREQLASQFVQRRRPDRANAPFDAAFGERELRRELLSTLTRLGHPMIDLYVIAMRQRGTLKTGVADGASVGKETDSESGSFLTAVLSELERQRAIPLDTREWGAFDELAAAAEQFDLILDVNEPGVRTRPLLEAGRQFGALLRQQQPVGGMTGQLNKTLVRQFRMPGYPFVLLSTDLLQEGEDLHTFCSDVYHYGLAWTPSAVEQRIGRVDRVRSKTERTATACTDTTLPEERRLQVFYPHLEDTVERLQVRRVLRRTSSSD